MQEMLLGIEWSAEAWSNQPLTGSAYLMFPVTRQLTFVHAPCRPTFLELDLTLKEIYSSYLMVVSIAV